MLAPLLKAALHPFAGLTPMRPVLYNLLHGTDPTGFLGLISGSTDVSLKQKSISNVVEAQ